MDDITVLFINVICHWLGSILSAAPRQKRSHMFCTQDFKDFENKTAPKLVRRLIGGYKPKI